MLRQARAQWLGNCHKVIQKRSRDLYSLLLFFVKILSVVEGLLPTATLKENGLMSFKDKQTTFKSMPTSGGGLTHIAQVEQNNRYGAAIYVIPNNENLSGLFLLKAGNNSSGINPTLIRIYGGKMNGKIYYKITGSTLDLYYKSSDSDTGPQDIFQTIIGTPEYTTYKGTIDDMTELVIS